MFFIKLILSIIKKQQIYFFQREYDYKNSKGKGSLLASMVPWKAFNVHGIFPLHTKNVTLENTVL